MPDGTKHCVHCNGEIGAKGIICRHCGMVQPEAATATRINATPGRVASRPQPGHSLWKVWIGYIVAFLFSLCTLISIGILAKFGPLLFEMFEILMLLLVMLLASVVLFIAVMIFRRGLLLSILIALVDGLYILLLGLRWGREVAYYTDLPGMDPISITLIVFGIVLLALAAIGIIIKVHDRKTKRA